MIPVFFSPKQVVEDDVGISPSARKPPLVIQSWKDTGFPIEIHEPAPASIEDFERAHDPDFVRGVLSCQIPNGFGNTLPSVAASLPWTSGSMLSAARYLLKNRGRPVAVSPTSGFHHASYGAAEGFCTFNGLMVTVQALRADGFDGRIGILDLDEHYGNGTDDIIRKCGVRDVRHYTFGAEPLKRRSKNDGIPGFSWIHHLPERIKSFDDCELVLYQAGADPHEHDPYSRGLLSTEMLAQRDKVVFQGLQALDIPVVWNLAGGYQTPLRKVLDIHDNTMRACVETFCGGPTMGGAYPP